MNVQPPEERRLWAGQRCSPLIGYPDCPRNNCTTGAEAAGQHIFASDTIKVPRVFLVHCCIPVCRQTKLTFMAKRRAEDTLLHESPSKRRYRALSGVVDTQLESMAPTGGVSPPSLLALMGSRCRKRPHYLEDPEKQEEEAAAGLYRKPTHCDTRKHAANVPTVQTSSGSFQDRRSSSTPTSSKKRPRDDCAGSETFIPKDKAEEDANSEDGTYNTFQYWRAPLPELNLSLLEDAGDRSQRKDEESKVKDSSSDAMET